MSIVRHIEIRDKTVRHEMKELPDRLYATWRITFIDDEFAPCPQRQTCAYGCVLIRQGNVYVAEHMLPTTGNYFKHKMSIRFGFTSSIKVSYLRDKMTWESCIANTDSVLLNTFSANFGERASGIHEFPVEMYLETYVKAYTHTFKYHIYCEKCEKYICGFSMEIPIDEISEYITEFREQTQQFATLLS